jgi:hypothetical protein
MKLKSYFKVRRDRNQCPSFREVLRDRDRVTVDDVQTQEEVLILH